MKINEIFYSIQGEGKNAGTPMIFIRLSGCNLRCDFCDTSYAFENGIEMAVPEIVSKVKKYPAAWICITGGEPLMQDIAMLVDELKQAGFNVQIETNGTVFQPVTWDWLTVSPKKGKEPHPVILGRADEIKLVIDSPEALAGAKRYEEHGAHLSVQPVDNREDMKNLCIDFVKANPRWRLSMQLHKLLDIR